MDATMRLFNNSTSCRIRKVTISKAANSDKTHHESSKAATT